MLSMALGWIPILGPLIQGLTGVFGKLMDTKVAVNQTNANRDVSEAQVSAQIIHDTNDDICLRLIRDFALVMPVAWGSFMGWDTIVAVRYPWLMWHTPDYPEAVRYLPYMAYVFLFGCIGMNMWKRK